MVVTDFNGAAIQKGDIVNVSDGLKVLGAGIILKKESVIKNIRLTNDPAEVDSKIKQTAIILRADFVKKM
ncbi:PhnA domain-containing protein [Flavobacteriaceae bacterium]|jgi:protein PhnA|nr:PhnA domain-containing protein [Flavobacteriaceae bacterium]